MNSKQQFLEHAAAANAVIVHASPVILDWESAPYTGEPENQVFTFRWYEGGMPYSTTLTEAGIAKGQFVDTAKFVCKDHEGDTTVVQFFRFEPVTIKHPLVTL